VRDETVKAWCDVLEPLLTDDDVYAAASARALTRWRGWSAADAVETLEGVMAGAIARRAGRKRQRGARAETSAIEVPEPAEF
jgi:hypothetical protein